LPAILAFQYRMFDFGRKSQRGHPCQKHPSRNTATRSCRKMKSGRPASLTFLRQPLRLDSLSSLMKLSSVVRLPEDRIFDIVRDRWARSMLSAIALRPSPPRDRRRFGNLIEDVPNEAVQLLGAEGIECSEESKPSDVFLRFPNEAPARNAAVPRRGVQELPGDGPRQGAASREEWPLHDLHNLVLSQGAKQMVRVVMVGIAEDEGAPPKPLERVPA